MITTKKKKIIYFILFLLPAVGLYALFFIFPLIQGVQYSFTDWNGITPEIPFSISREKFEGEILAQIKKDKDREFLRRYYIADETGGFYRLANWLQEKGGAARPLTDSEKKKIKAILKSVGISNIKFIGFANYQEMFRDKSFMPRYERKSLFNEFSELPEAIEARVFRKNLLSHIDDENEKTFLLTKYQYDKSASAYLLTGELKGDDEDRLRKILSEDMYKTILIRGVIGFTLFFTFFNVILANFCGLALALILDTKMKYRNLLRSMFFLPNVISLIIVAYIWSFMFRLIFPLLTGISIWLGSPELAPYATIMVAVWQGCGYLMVIYLAGLQTIPAEISEAAEVDGARWYQRLYHIKFPLLLPAFTICLFYSLSNSLRTFDIIMALTQGGPGYVTTPIVVDIYKNAFQANRFGYATAKAVLLCLIIIVVTGIQLAIMKRKEVEL